MTPYAQLKYLEAASGEQVGDQLFFETMEEYAQWQTKSSQNS